MSLIEITPFQWGLAILSAFCFGMSKTGFGGIAVLGVLLMAQILPVRESTGVVLPMLITADLYAVYVFRSHVVWKTLWKILPGSVLGITLGWYFMPIIPMRSFGPLIGWLIIGLLVLTVFQKYSTALQKVAGEHPVVAWPLGILAGFITMIANAGGAVITIYLLACRLPKYEFVGTAAWFFFLCNLIKVPFSISLGLITPQTLMLNAALIPAILCGLFLGKFLLSKVNQSLFEWLLIVLSFLGSLRLVLS